MKAIREAIKYFGDVFNLEITNEFTILDINEELEDIENIGEFRKFVKNRIAYDKYKYLKPYEKFITLANDFKRDNSPKLDDDTELKIHTFTNKLFSKLVSFSNNLEFHIQEKGIKLDEINLFETYQKALMLEPKEIEICLSMGINKKLAFQYIYKNVKINQERLRNKIEEAITKKAFLKKFPQLNKLNFEGIDTIKKLKSNN